LFQNNIVQDVIKHQLTILISSYQQIFVVFYLLEKKPPYLYHPPNGRLGLAALDDDTVDWLKRLHWTSDDKIGPNEEDL